MLNNKEKEVVKNYYLEDYINTIRYILTFDEDINNKYSVYIENKIFLDLKLNTCKIGI